MNYTFKKITNFHNPNPLFFLCGVKYNENNPHEDKRVVLKNYLNSKGYCSIILEEHFVPGMNRKKLGYKFIKLENLNDVETLACMLVDGIFIIHESQSTAAEIALFSSHESVAEKVFVLVPDIENSEEDHFSGFLYFAYKNIIKEPITFYPITEKHIISENTINIFTYFNSNQIGENLSTHIDDYICTINKTKNLTLAKRTYNNKYNSIVYYFTAGSIIRASINVQYLKYYILALFNISEFRNEFKSTTRFFDAVSSCEKWFKRVLLNTIIENEKTNNRDFKLEFEILNSINPRLDLRKAISLTLYSFHALGWISINPSENRGITISKKTEESSGFKSIYIKYADIINEYQPFDFEDFIL